VPARVANQARSRRAASARGDSRRLQTRRRAGSASLPILVVERLRWDRLGRVALLFALLALVYLYLSAGVRMFSTYREERADRASVAALTREHAALLRRRRILGRQSTVEGEARRLGLARSGEQQYVVSGLPNN
jgi:Flp pilus assembly protein TadG